MTLTAESVSRGFGSVTVVDGVSLDIDAGTFAAVLGPNGSGKTTLLRVLAGVLAPDEGTVACETDAPRQIGYMPQQPSFRPGFTAAETLDIYTALVPTDDDTETLLDRVGLAHTRDGRATAGQRSEPGVSGAADRTERRTSSPA